MALPTVSWNEATPANTDLFSEGDDRIRELKTQMRELFALDHIWESSGQGSAWGRHNTTTLQVQTSDPSAVEDTIILYSKDGDSGKAALYFIDEDSNTHQLTCEDGFVGGMASERRMYSGLVANIPEGWEVDADYAGTYLRGVDNGSTDPGTSGGSNSMTLAIANIASHAHTFTAPSAGSHCHHLYNPYLGQYTYRINTMTQTGTWPGGCPTANSLQSYPGSTGSGGSHTHSGTTGSTGSGTAFDNQPAYYELCFLKRSS